MIVSYQKYIDSIRTIELRIPYEGQQRPDLELATIDGTTYVYLPDGTIIPEQAPEITLTEVILTDALRASICAASPHVELISSRVVDMIRLRYTINDEIKMLRIAPSDESTQYNSYVEECRAWGREQRALIGL